jgi:hypothetical protein
MMKTAGDYIDRLVDEWKKHGRIIIAVDFDDTLSPWTFTTEQDIYDSGIIQLLANAKATGAYIVCFTACKPDRYHEIEARFKFLGIPLDSINKNPIELPYGNVAKIYANIFLDDRAGLPFAMYVLETAMWRYRGYLEGKRNLADIG